MQSLIVDIINVKALKLLQDLEMMQLIRLRKEPPAIYNGITQYKGAMGKQPTSSVDEQLNDLRNGWE